MSSSKISLYAATSLALVIVAAAASAQDTNAAATPPAPVETEGASNSGDIVVTARRREEILQRVPVEITAFSQGALERRAISDPFSLNKAVPGLQVVADSGSNALPTFSIRGRGQYFGAASGSVETYFADVPLSPPNQVPTLPPQFFDLQSAQVLKGPQGTLFGRNTTGGAVLFVPQAPTDEFGGYVRVQGGTYNDLQVEGAVNVPITDKALLRVAGFRWFRKGYTRTIPFRTTLNPDGTRGPDVRTSDPDGELLSPQRYDNQDVTEARATLLLKPTDNLTNSTIFTFHADENRGAMRLIKVNLGQPTFYGQLANASYLDYNTSSYRATRINVDLHRKASQTFAVINTTALDVADNFTIKNIFGYINAKAFTNNPNSVDGFPAAAIDLPAPRRQLRNFQTTDELQFQGNLLDEKLTYIFGGLIDLTREPGSNGSINIKTNTFPAGNGTQYDVQFRQSTFTSESLFGSFTYKLTDQLSFSGGVRHAWDDVKERNCEYNTYPSPTDASVCAVTPHTDALGNVIYTGFISGKKNFRGFSYNASAEFRPAVGSLVYGGYRHGYKRGGFNAKGNGLALFGPEKVDDYYVGLKQDVRIGGIRGHFNIEGFWDGYKGAQRGYLAFDPSVGALTTVIANVPKETYRGFDMDVVLDVTPWLELSGNYTFVDSKFNKYGDNTCNISGPSLGLPAGNYCFNQLGIPGGPLFISEAAIQARNPGDLTANKPGLVSRNKLSVTARLHHTLADGGELAFSPSFNYQSLFYFDDAAFRLPNASAAVFGPVNSQAAGADQAPGYKTVDLRLEWDRVLGSSFDLAANVTNLTNKTFINGGSSIYQLGFGAVTFGPPRLFYAEVKFHF